MTRWRQPALVMQQSDKQDDKDDEKTTEKEKEPTDDDEEQKEEEQDEYDNSMQDCRNARTRNKTEETTSKKWCTRPPKHDV